MYQIRTSTIHKLENRVGIRSKICPKCCAAEKRQAIGMEAEKWRNRDLLRCPRKAIYCLGCRARVKKNGPGLKIRLYRYAVYTCAKVEPEETSEGVDFRGARPRLFPPPPPPPLASPSISSSSSSLLFISSRNDMIIRELFFRAIRYLVCINLTFPVVGIIYQLVSSFVASRAVH